MHGVAVVVWPFFPFLWCVRMRICYVDEAGCTGGLPTATADIQPVFILCGVDLPLGSISEITREFISIKQQYFPRHVQQPDAPYLAWIPTEIKGADVRRHTLAGSRNKRRHAIGVLERVVRLLENHGARLYGRVIVKGVGRPCDGRAVYTSALQYIYRWFDHSLKRTSEKGIVVCDSRVKPLNTVASYSIFTQKHRARGDPFPRVLESPLFSHSENHAGVQLADLVCSGLLFPLAVHAYCRGQVRNIHVRDYSEIRERFTNRLEALQVRDYERYNGRRGKLSGGITVDEGLGHRPRALMFPGGNARLSEAA